MCALTYFQREINRALGSVESRYRYVSSLDISIDSEFFVGVNKYPCDQQND